MDDLIKRIKEIARRGFKEPEAITPEDINTVGTCLVHSAPSIVAHAYWAVGQIGIKNPDGVEQYIARAFQDLAHPHPEVREKALFAIGRTGRAKVALVNTRIDELIQVYQDQTPKVRMAMIWACENIANSDAGLFEPYISVFEELLSDEDEQYVLREAPEIFRVIGKYRPELVERSLPILKEKLKDSCRVTRIHSEGAIRIIEKGLKKGISQSLPPEQIRKRRKR